MCRVAIMGAGNMGKKHAGCYGSIPGARVVCVVDPNEGLGRALAEKLGCAYAPDVNDVEKGSVDMIDICLPTFLHVSAIEQAAQVCGNIVCEKPLALDPAEIAKVEALVEEKSLRLMIAHVLRFTDKYAAAKRLVDENAVGKINAITCLRRQKKPNWIVGGWLTNFRLSGGLAYDLAIHDLDYIAWLMGRPRKIFATAVDAADGSVAHLRAQLVYDGCVAAVFSSWGMPAGYNGGELESSFEIIGEAGRVYGDGNGAFTLSDGETTRDIPYEPNDGYREELAYFIDCLEKGEEPVRANVAAVRNALDMARAINRSIELGRAVDMDEKEGEA